MTAQAPHDRPASLIFGKYDIVRRHAIGGMAEIFLAKQSGIAGLDRHVILKSLLPDLTRDPTCIEEFLDEARVAAKLSHPNIVTIFEVGLWDGNYFIAMEYIDGENLRALSESSSSGRNPLSTSITTRIIHDTAVALHHAHTAVGEGGARLSIVHRDVSPQNIMVRLDGVTKVLDFGIAKAAVRATRTSTGVLKGKVRYMSPEQLRGGEDLDARSDQYSLGVVLWEMLTGQRLFKSDLHIAERLMDKPITPPSSLVPDVPPDLDAITLRMLEADPEQRFPSLKDVASSLKRHLDANPETSSIDAVASFVRRARRANTSETSGDDFPRENFVISLAPPGATDQDAAETRVDRPTLESAPSAQPFRARRRTTLVLAFVLGFLSVATFATLLWPTNRTPARENEAQAEELPPAGAALDLEPTSRLGPLATDRASDAAPRGADHADGTTPSTSPSREGALAIEPVRLVAEPADVDAWARAPGELAPSPSRPKTAASKGKRSHRRGARRSDKPRRDENAYPVPISEKEVF